MTGIMTVTLNPALDLSTRVNAVLPEAKLRCAAPLIDTGGGGINVARAIGQIGGRARAFVVLSGHVGAQFAGLLAREPLEPVIHDLPGETRQSLAVTDETDGRQYRFVMPGPVWTGIDVDAVLKAILAAMPEGGLVVLSGSQPPGVPDDFPARLAGLVQGRGGRLVVDTSGGPMKALAARGGAAPDVLRLDGAESAELAGAPLTTPRETADFAAALVAQGVAGMVILARGPDGSVLATPEGRWHANTPDVPVLSKVGAGDSFVGAFTLALAAGATPQEALIRGVAGASAAVMTDATELCRREDVDTLAAAATLTAL